MVEVAARGVVTAVAGALLWTGGAGVVVTVTGLALGLAPPPAEALGVAEVPAPALALGLAVALGPALALALGLAEGPTFT